MKKKYIIIVVVGLILTNLILFTSMGDGIAVGTVNMYNKVTTFFKSGYTNMISNIGDINELYSRVDNLSLTNEQLSAANQKINDENDMLEIEKKQIQDAIKGREFFDTSIRKFGQKSELVGGQIILRDLNTWNNSATVNIGSDHGALKGQAVISNGYLVGFITEINSTTSKMILLSNENEVLNIPIMAISGNKEINMILTNYNSETGKYTIKPISMGQRLSTGDEIFTNGYQEGIIKGIPIGKISEEIIDNDTGSVEYLVTPGTDIANTRLIEVVLND